MNAAARIRYLLAEKKPAVLGYDQAHWAEVFDYHSARIELALAAVDVMRAHTANLLRRLPEESWSAEGTHTDSGRYTAEDWLETYAEHLEKHSRQIERTLERLAGRADDASSNGEVMLKEFKAFLLKQNALALAIGVMIGASIGKIVTAIADDVINPVIGLLLPGGDWRKAHVALSHSVDATGKVTENSITYGHLIGSMVDFVIIAFVLFLIVRTLVPKLRGDGPTTSSARSARNRFPSMRRAAGRARSRSLEQVLPDVPADSRRFVEQKQEVFPPRSEVDDADAQRGPYLSGPSGPGRTSRPPPGG